MCNVLKIPVEIVVCKCMRERHMVRAVVMRGGAKAEPLVFILYIYVCKHESF